MSFGSQFKIIRNSYKLSQTKFARVIGCSISALDTWEQENALPSEKNWDRIVQKLPWNDVLKLREEKGNRNG